MPSLRLRAAVAGATACAAVAFATAPADAAPPWSEPQLVPDGHLARWAPVATGGLALRNAPAGLLGFTQGGTGFAVLGRGDGLGYARFSGARGAFGAVTASAFGGVEPAEMALFGRSGVILAGAADRSSDRRHPGNGVPLDTAVSRGDVTGGFGARQILRRGFFVRGVLGANSRAAVVTAAAANPAGDAAVTVSYPVLNRRGTLVAGYRNQLFIRRRGGERFRPVLQYGRRTVGSSPSALAVNGPGDVLLAWDDRLAVRARLISARGTVGSEQRLGTGGSAHLGGGATRIVAAIDGTRRMLVAWLAQRAGSSGNAGGPGLVAAAAAAPGRSFAGQLTLEAELPRGDNALIGGTAVQGAILRDRSVVAWTGAEGGRQVVRTADIVSGRARPAVRLSAAGGVSRLEGLAVGPRGGALVIWTARTGAPGHFASGRSAGTSAWGPVETITTGSDTTGIVSPSIAVSPVSGQVVAMVSDPVPVTGPPARGPVPVRSSVRAAP